MLLSACIDFVAPDVPQIGAPAVFEGAVRVIEGGEVRIDGELTPGLDEDGIRRSVVREAMIALDDSILPRDVEPDGTLIYLERRPATPGVTAGPFHLEAPVVLGVDPPPSIRWSGIVKLDPDTLALEPDSDLELRTLTAGTDMPAPLSSSWTLILGSGDDLFRIGANGAPPALIQVPDRWLPGSDSTISADLIYLRRHSVGPETTSYIGVFVVQVTLRWTIVRVPEPGDGDGAGG